MTYSTITSKGQTTIPASIREQLKLKPGDKVQWSVRNGHAEMVPKNRSILDFAGMFYEPGRKTVTIEEMNDAIAEEAALSGMAGLKPKR